MEEIHKEVIINSTLYNFRRSIRMKQNSRNEKQSRIKRGQWDLSCRSICMEALSTVDLLDINSWTGDSRWQTCTGSRSMFKDALTLLFSS